MNEEVMAWLNSPESQPYLQQVGISQKPTVTGYESDPYVMVLNKLISGNSQNPTFQKSLIGEYLNYINPYNSDAMNTASAQEELLTKKKESDINAAFDMIDVGTSTGDAEMVATGKSILNQAYGGYNIPTPTQQTTTPVTSSAQTTSGYSSVPSVFDVIGDVASGRKGLIQAPLEATGRSLASLGSLIWK